MTFLCAAVLSVLGACADHDANGTPAEGTIVVLNARQVTTGSLRIGAGNFRGEGESRTAKLWFYVKSRDELNRTQRVSMDEELTIAGRRFRVAAITTETVVLQELGGT